ncbi:hypothetical protein [Streptomyces sp. NPDC021212]|uniref:hypothetical protein n=1 Tax=Streptomyces sp. NPDC021212 TaxID=3365118 RepID=UPI003796E2A0
MPQTIRLHDSRKARPASEYSNHRTGRGLHVFATAGQDVSENFGLEDALGA